ncbi:deoxyribonuclease [Clostridia bacterium]|nr:deoxyribonuclease [Clostridia bacterium]
MLFDTHTHLCIEEYNDEDRARIIASLQADGVTNILEIGEIPYTVDAINLANKYDFIYASVGAHPYHAKELSEKDMELFKELAINNNKVVAVGEIGLDYHAEHGEYKAEQKYWFQRQIELAQELNLPIIVHDRDAHEDCLEILKKMNVDNGIIHCFSADTAFAKEVCDMGMYVAFGGALTYKNVEQLVEAAGNMPLDRLLIETDCPFLSPQAVRGTRNEPKNVRYVAEKIAEIRGMSVDEVAKVTSDNAIKLFGLH